MQAPLSQGSEKLQRTERGLVPGKAKLLALQPFLESGSSPPPEAGCQGPIFRYWLGQTPHSSGWLEFFSGSQFRGAGGAEVILGA